MPGKDGEMILKSFPGLQTEVGIQAEYKGKDHGGSLPPPTSHLVGPVNHSDVVTILEGQAKGCAQAHQQQRGLESWWEMGLWSGALGGHPRPPEMGSREPTLSPAGGGRWLGARMATQTLIPSGRPVYACPLCLALDQVGAASKVLMEHEGATLKIVHICEIQITIM